MSDYVYYPDPDQVPVLEYSPLSLSEEDLEAIRSIVASSPMAVRAAHLYDRKGYFSTDNFAGNPNPAYRGTNDDIVIQVSVVIQSDHIDPDKYEALTGIYDRVQTAKHEAEVAARQAEVARAEADLLAAQARLATLRQD